MMDFAFLGRVSTRDAQQPEQSRQWQLKLATQLVESHGHRIRFEFFDVGQSRSVPWSLRPRAGELLAAIARPDRPFDAVVVGEPHRAFYGSQFQMTFPVLIHYGVELWVPEVGGRVDPDSDAHDVLMSLFGGMSKAERSRIRKRTRTAMHEIAKHSDLHLGGRPPYGYLLADAGRHGNQSKAAAGGRAHRLAPDPLTAPVVERIFVMRAGGESLASIASALNVEGVPSPSAHDPERNPHRTGAGWTSGSIRAILHNPSYLGTRVWGKSEKVERLVDVADVALGYATTMRGRDRAEWIVPTTQTHEPLVTADLFRSAHDADQHTAAARAPRLYPLSGHLRCAHCDNLMAATFTRTNRENDAGRAYYRCETGKKARPGDDMNEHHPRSVLVSQARIVRALDSALIALFADVRELAKQVALSSRPTTEISVTRRRIAQLGAEIDSLGGGAFDQDHSLELAEQRARLTAARARYRRHLDDLQWAVVKSGDRSTAIGIALLKEHVEGLVAANDAQQRAVYAHLRLAARYDADSRTAQCSIEPLALVVGPAGRARYPGLRHEFVVDVPQTLRAAGPKSEPPSVPLSQRSVTESS